MARLARPRIVGVGGTVRNLATAVQHASACLSSGPGIRDRARAARRLIDGSPRCRRRAPPRAGIKPARGDIVLAGAVVIQSVLEAGGFAGIEATEAGLREGIFFERLLAGPDEPLIDDVRRASVLNLAAQYDTTPAHTRHVARARARPVRRARRRRPPRRATRSSASCSRPPRMLHDIGVADRLRRPPQALALPDPQRRPARLQPARGRPDRPGRALPPQGHAGPRAVRVARARRRRRLLPRCSTLLRLAEDLERSRDQDVREAHVAAEATGAGAARRSSAGGEARGRALGGGARGRPFERAFGRGSRCRAPELAALLGRA